MSWPYEKNNISISWPDFVGLEIKNLELLTKFTIYVVNNVIQSDKKYPKSLM